MCTKHFFKLLLVAILITCAMPSYAGKILRVGVSVIEPFSYVVMGDYKGIATDIWDEIAQKNGWQYQYINMGENVDEAIAAVESGKLDVLIGPISVHYDRLQKVAFTRPYFLNQIGMAVRETHVSFWEVMRPIVFVVFNFVLVGLVLLLLVVSHLVWFVERRRNPEFSGNYWRGVGNAMWLTVTSLLQGEVVHNPQTLTGRVVMGVWLILALFVMAGFTASITSALTVSLSKNHQALHSPTELERKTVAVVKGTSNIMVALKFGAKVIEVNHLDDAMEKLAKGEVDGVVEDFVIAKTYLRHHPEQHLQMANVILTYDELAFVFPKQSKLLPLADLEITRLQDHGLTKAICETYIMTEAHFCEM